MLLFLFEMLVLLCWLLMLLLLLGLGVGVGVGLFEEGALDGPDKDPVVEPSARLCLSAKRSDDIYNYIMLSLLCYG